MIPRKYHSNKGKDLAADHRQQMELDDNKIMPTRMKMNVKRRKQLF